MKLTFPASWRQELPSTQTPEQDKERMTCAAQALGWAKIGAAESSIEFRVEWNWKSWGERITVSFQPGKILIDSRCSFPLQCFDWGKNKENCLLLSQAHANR